MHLANSQTTALYYILNAQISVWAKIKSKMNVDGYYVPVYTVLPTLRACCLFAHILSQSLKRRKCARNDYAKKKECTLSERKRGMFERKKNWANCEINKWKENNQPKTTWATCDTHT